MRLDLTSQLLELLHSLVLARGRTKQLDQHDPDVLASRKLVGELLDRSEGQIELA